MNEESMIESSSGFRKLTAWQKAQDLAVEITLELDRKNGRMRATSVADQLLRSAGSIAANIAEGYGRYSPGAYRNHLSIARGSLFETESWLDLLYRTDRLSQEAHSVLLGQCTEIGRLLTTTMRGLRGSTGRISEEREPYSVDFEPELMDEA